MSPIIQSADEPNDESARHLVERVSAYRKEMQDLGYGQPPRPHEQQICSEGGFSAQTQAKKAREDVEEKLAELVENFRFRRPVPQLKSSRIDQPLGEKYQHVRLDLKFPVGRVDGSGERVEVSLRSNEVVIGSRSFQIANAISYGSLQGEDRVLPGLVHILDSIEKFLGVQIKTSLAGHGVHCACTSIASTEAATSVVGDSVRDGGDIPPEALDTSVEDSTATGAADPSRRPHPKPSSESGSDQR
ncbi:hypothetical protein [Brevibacterium linens]|uniref:hypothetical protein n=1 Tax=Brevibacterium linens TaxID=1703 RepID=UPI003BF5AD88